MRLRRAEPGEVLRGPEVVELFRYRDRRGFGAASYRAECTRVTARRWRWRVWAVLGGGTVATDIVHGARTAEAQAVHALGLVAEQAGRCDGGG